MPRKSPENWDDAKFAMQEIGGWIKNADAKVTILGAGLGVLFAATASRLEDFLTSYRAMGSVSCVFLALLLALGAAFIAVGVSVYIALRPRTVHTPRNRFAWPALAEIRGAISFPHEGVASEAWAQVLVLSAIAKRKYRAFDRGLTFFGLSLVLFGALVVWSSIAR